MFYNQLVYFSTFLPIYNNKKLKNKLIDNIQLY